MLLDGHHRALCAACTPQGCAGSVRASSSRNPPCTRPEKKGARAGDEEFDCWRQAARARRDDAAPPAAFARRSLFGTVDPRTGRRVLLVRKHQRLADYRTFLRRLRHGVGACGALWLLLDRHGSHRSPSSLRLAAKLGVRLFWLPRQHPKLNPVDHLWRGLKNHFAANRQFASVDDLASHAEGWVRALTPTQTLRKAGLLSPNCRLRRLRKTLWPST